MPRTPHARQTSSAATRAHKRAASAVAATLIVLSAAACGIVGSGTSKATKAAPTTSGTPVTVSLELPTAASGTTQPSPSTITFGAPVIAGYGRPSSTATEATDGTTAEATSADEETTDATWSSRTTRCLLTAQVSSSSALLVSGADDRQLSRAAAEAALDSYDDDASTGSSEATIGTSTPYAGISTAFTASLDGQDADGRSFTRVWGADGASLKATEICPAGAFDEAAWSLALEGTEVSGVSTTSTWPGGEPTPSPEASEGSTAS